VIELEHGGIPFATVDARTGLEIREQVGGPFELQRLLLDPRLLDVARAVG
jgi:hypothetical protein